MDKNIFISYSHRDTEVVDFIVGRIKSLTGMGVWIDSSLRGGENYFSVIADQIMKSTYFVFIVSENSVISDWCLRELEFAASERIAIVAIWINDVIIPPRVRLVIQNTQYINYFSLSEESFSEAINRAFLDDNFTQCLDNERNDDANDNDRESIREKKYFIERPKIKKIEELLSHEDEHRYSVCFQAENAYLLGLAYEMGIKRDIDLKQAEFYYKISDYKGSYDGKYLYAAIRSEQEGADVTELLSEKIDAAEHQSVFALTYLGDDYYYGRNGCNKNLEKAYAYFKMAAEAGSAVAMYYMAYGHRHGEIVEKDIELSYMYALMATEYGFPRAYRILAFIYKKGELFGTDNQKAIQLFEEAIARGDYQSLCYEGDIYGDNKDYEKQRELYEKALKFAVEDKIKSGVPFYRMGWIYEYGEGVPKDMEKAAEYYLLGAERKHENSLQYVVSTIMEIENQETRKNYLNRAFELGCDDAAYRLGEIEESEGDGQRFSDKAVEYYSKGAESGDIWCAQKLIYNYSYVLGNSDGKNEDDRKEAIKWFQFFFANADEEHIAYMRKEKYLATFYYAYAIEMDLDPDISIPDRTYVKMYFKKSLDESPKHLWNVVNFVSCEYLFPQHSLKGSEIDVIHAQEMLELSENYLGVFYEYLESNEDPEALQKWKNLRYYYIKSYYKIADCYEKGISVEKNMALSETYKGKAENIEIIMGNIAS